MLEKLGEDGWYNSQPTSASDFLSITILGALVVIISGYFLFSSWKTNSVLYKVGMGCVFGASLLTCVTGIVGFLVN